MLPKCLTVGQTPQAEFKFILEKQRSVREHQTPELAWGIPGAPKSGGKLLKLPSMSKNHGNVVGEQDKQLSLLPAPPFAGALSGVPMCPRESALSKKGKIHFQMHIGPKWLLLWKYPEWDLGQIKLA